MSDAEHTDAQGHTPEFAVVGEPASEPHQAVVMGEPQEDAAPVLGEPVPLANGLQGDPAKPPPGSEEPAINGFQEVSHLHYHQAEASLHDQEEVVDPLQLSEESLASSESLAEVNTSRSEAPAEESPNPSDAPAEETSSPLDALVQETPTALDAPAGETSCAPDAPAEDNLSAAEEPNATSDSAEAAHAADSAAESLGPVEVSPEIPTEIPCLSLEEASAANQEAPSETLTVDPVAEEMSLIEAPLASAAPDEEAFPTLSREVLGSSHATYQEGIPVKESSATPATQEEPLTEVPTSSQIVPEGSSLTGSKLSEAAQEEALAAESVQIYQEDAPLQEAVASDIVPGKPIDEEAIETKHSEEVSSVQGTEIIESLRDESHAREPDISSFDGSSVDPSLEVAHAASEEVSQAEGSTNENHVPGTDTPHEDATLLDAHHVQNNMESSVEAIVMNTFETPIPSQTTRETPIEVFNPGQSPTKELLAEEFTLKETPPAMSESSQDHEPEGSGENGFQSVEEANHVAEREQEFSMDDENAEGKEKPSSRIKLPLIVTGLAIAAVGVAVASISRTHV